MDAINKFRRIRLYFFLILISFNLYGNDNLKGEWIYKDYNPSFDNNKTPYSVLKLILEINKDEVKGSFEYFTQWFGRAQDPKEFENKIINNKFSFLFNSDWGGKNGKVEITLNKDCSLDWNLIKEPDGEYYAPYKAHLIVNKLEINDLCKNIKTSQLINFLNKTQLYKTPSEDSITKMYLIAGDKADLLEEKTDEKGVKWYNILYHGKKDINAWIKADESVNLDSENK